MRERIRRRRSSRLPLCMRLTLVCSLGVFLSPSSYSGDGITGCSAFVLSNEGFEGFLPFSTALEAHSKQKRSSVNTESPIKGSSQAIGRKQIRSIRPRPTPSPHGQRSVHRQFQSRTAQYEEETLHGREWEHENDFRKRNNPHTFESNNKKKPSKSEGTDLTERIKLMLRHNDDTFLASHEIADRQTVFSQLSDEDKSQATFAVSKISAMNNGAFALEERERGNKRKVVGKVTANVLETGQDTMKRYVKSMGQHQVLRPEDEAVLGRQIQILAQWEEKRQELEGSLGRPPKFSEWAQTVDTSVPELKKQIRRSQQAKAALVEANLRLVVTVARQTVKKGRSEINFQDACQEGILGLTRASEKFDPEKGFRFSSYAVWWIKKMIHKNVTDQSRPVRLPASVIQKINDIRINEKVLQGELGRKPRDDELASKVGITVERLEFLRKSGNEVMSLDKKVKFLKESDNNNAPEMHAVVKDPDLSPAELAQKQMLKEDVRRLIRTLSPREQAVVRLRFGLDNGTPRTLQQIGDKFSVDKEVVRKIEARALRKLRQPYRNQSLKAYISDL